ncbi:hypothetical protein FPV67DRAFT_1674279 [Lyophyllum atratum]|nr:hypothetical protein FPV67DRAFT_1674279 [Lyophyllum atratum]
MPPPPQVLRPGAERHPITQPPCLQTHLPTSSFSNAELEHQLAALQTLLLKPTPKLSEQCTHRAIEHQLTMLQHRTTLFDEALRRAHALLDHNPGAAATVRVAQARVSRDADADVGLVLKELQRRTDSVRKLEKRNSQLTKEMRDKKRQGQT